MISTVYKVVVESGKQDGVYLSVCSQWPLMRRCMLEYRLGQITEPKIEGSKLFAFTDLKRATEFGRVNVNWQYRVILECEAHIDDKIHLGVISMLSATNVVRFWQESLYKKYNNILDRVGIDSRINIMSAPKDTICCDWVKPIGVM